MNYIEFKPTTNTYRIIYLTTIVIMIMIVFEH